MADLFHGFLDSIEKFRPAALLNFKNPMPASNFSLKLLANTGRSALVLTPWIDYITLLMVQNSVGCGRIRRFEGSMIAGLEFAECEFNTWTGRRLLSNDRPGYRDRSRASAWRS